MPIQKKVNKNFFKKWTREMSYILGFFAADGYITVNKRGGEYWCIQITDKDLLYSIREEIESKHQINIRASKNAKSSIVYRLQIGSKEMCSDLRELGFTERKTKSLAIPNIPKEYFSHFVRGYFDGDGNIWMGRVHKNRKTTHLVLKLTFTSGSCEFIKRLHTELNFFGLDGGCIYRSKKGQFCRLQYSTINALKLYYFMYNRISTSKLFLGRKKDVFEEYIKKRL